MKNKVTVEGMKCDGCANAVKNKFQAIEGVEQVEVDLPNNQVTFESDKTIDRETLAAALAGTNYSVTEIA